MFNTHSHTLRGIQVEPRYPHTKILWSFRHIGMHNDTVAKVSLFTAKAMWASEAFGSLKQWKGKPMATVVTDEPVEFGNNHLKFQTSGKWPSFRRTWRIYLKLKRKTERCQHIPVGPEYTRNSTDYAQKSPWTLAWNNQYYQLRNNLPNASYIIMRRAP